MDKLNEVFISSEICYNFGAAFDILNPLVHTNCKTMICIDVKDDEFYKQNTKSHLPFIINRLLSQIDTFNKQIINIFEDVNVVLLEDEKFMMTMQYKNEVKTIIYYVGDGNVFIPPEIKVANNTIDCLWLSMSYIKKSTIDFLQPKYIVEHHTKLDGQLVDFTVDRIINTIRIDPFVDAINIDHVILTLYRKS
jgi:hypothetical protein